MTGVRTLGLAKWAAIYFALVFGVGFALGPIRVLWLEPKIGARAAELVEAPFMLLAIVLAGRWVGRRVGSAGRTMRSLGVGLAAAGLVLAADLAVGVGLRGMTVAQVFTERDPVSGAVYYALVALTAVAPWVLGRFGDRTK
jgi:anti-sigma factor RsiW